MSDIVQRLISGGVSIMHRKVMFEKFIVFKKNDVVKLNSKVRGYMNVDVLGFVAFVGGNPTIMRKNNLGIQELIISDSQRIIINWDYDGEDLISTSWFPENLIRVKEWKKK
jgi:hypothetical protein